MFKTIAELENMCKVKGTLMEWIKLEIEEGREAAGCHIEQIGELVDMVKDLSDAEEKCMKKKYYEMLICDLMLGDEDMQEVGRMGYDNWRYASGKFAPTGHGHRSGYMPSWPHNIDFRNPVHMEDDMAMHDGDIRHREPYYSDRMGYPTTNRDMAHQNTKEENAYDKYLKSRRHYHESKDAGASMEMNRHIEEASMEALDGIREMWKDGSPETRKKIKNGLSSLMEDTK